MSHHETNEKTQDVNIDTLALELKNSELYEGILPEIQCMDGRINGGHGLAGSGILLERDPKNPDLPAEKYMQNFRDKVEKGELKEICWHSNCGAAGLYLKSKGIEPTEDAKDAVAKDFAEKLGKALGIPVKKSAHEMADHSEKGVYIDATDKFNTAKLDTESKELPNGFLLSPNVTKNLDYNLNEIEVAISISFGDHGPGPDSFSPEKPYFIMLICDEERPDYFKDFAKKIQGMIDNNKKFEKYANKIVIKTVTPELK